MSYLVLARKLRPAKFRDLIGQESICRTLVNAIGSDRVAHAFLFTGPRGTGKTSCARILTKALNCQSLVDSEPCGQCENCREINLGISTDVLEIDAASNRGIEHIRELREGVKFSPAKCRYKTYIIDEVHMLTTESFNALLKTLEEPPPHVKFILATTDHYKVPPTVISRCQRYDFSNIPTELMLSYLKKVAEDEKTDISESALRLIARSSVGGMRDALTILDMLISFSEEKIQDEKVIEILGLNDVREIDGLLKLIIEKDLAAALSLWDNLFSKGRSITRLVADLMRSIKNLSLVKALPEDKMQWHQFLPDQLDLYRGLSSKTTVSSLQRMFNIMLEVEGQIKRSSQAEICFEMGLMKMCSLESLAGVGEIVSVLRKAGKRPGARQPLFNQRRSEAPRTIPNETGFSRETSSNRAESFQQRPSENDKPKASKTYPRNLSEGNLSVKEPDPRRQPPAYITENESVPSQQPPAHITENEDGPINQQPPAHITENEDGPSQQPSAHIAESEPAPPEQASANADRNAPPPTLRKDDKPERHELSAEKKKSAFEQWESFINYMTESEKAGQPLLSLLNNSAVLELNGRKLVIGYGNIEFFDEEKRKHIDKAARSFFNPSLKVVYQEHDDKTAVTLRGQKEKEKKRLMEQKRKAAVQDQKVKEILETFPDSRIAKIEILQEQTYV